MQQGTRVRCVDASGCGPRLVVGEVYTVADVTGFMPSEGEMLRTVRLVEIPGAVFGLPPYAPEHFEPVSPSAHTG